MDINSLFSFGNTTKEVTIKDVVFRLAPLNSKRLKDAFSGSMHLDGNAQNLEYKLQILARAIVNISGADSFVDTNKPTTEEITNQYKKLEELHISLLDKLYQAYDELDTEVGKEVADNIKK